MTGDQYPEWVESRQGRHGGDWTPDEDGGRASSAGASGGEERKGDGVAKNVKNSSFC